MFVAEFNQRFAPGDAAARFQGAGAVIQSGVNNSAVVAGLVAGNLGFLFEDQ